MPDNVNDVEEILLATLAEARLAWTPRDQGWLVSGVCDGRELLVERADDAFVCRGMLASWAPQLTAEAEEALAELLAEAERRSGVRHALGRSGAEATATVPQASIRDGEGEELLEAMRSVALAVRRVAPAARALAESPGLAREYLRVRRDKGVVAL